MLLVAIRAKNVSPLHWLLVLGLMGRVANRVCGVAGCDSGEKYFAPTLVGGVGADGSGCEQGMRCCWLRFGRKIFRPYIGCWWGLTGRVANRYAVVMVCDAGEKYFAPTSVVVGADGSGCEQGMRW